VKIIFTENSCELLNYVVKKANSIWPKHFCFTVAMNLVQLPLTKPNKLDY